MKRIVLFATLLFLGVLGGEGCGKPDIWLAVQPSTSCDPTQALPQIPEYESLFLDKSGEIEDCKDACERACLVVIWVGQEKKQSYFEPVLLEKDGLLHGYNEAKKRFNVPLRLELNKEGLQGEPPWKVQLRLFVLRRLEDPAANNNKEAALQRHTKFCKETAAPAYNCLVQGDCWFFLKFPGKFSKEKPFQVEEMPKGCQVCSRKNCSNNKDNDCDGKEDVDCPLCQQGETEKCYSGFQANQDVGACKSGVRTCTAEGQWGSCKQSVLPQPETCNGIDDDCDGNIDNIQGSTRFLQRPCYDEEKYPGTRNKGNCKDGYQLCKNGKWEGNPCQEARIPAPETCNDRDDNCDGLIDENLTRPCFKSTRGGCALEKDGKYKCIAPCKAGTQTCTKGSWGHCQGMVDAKDELCDGKDNNCDGQIDETFAQKGRTCSVSGKKGPCEKGTYTACKGGKLVCSAGYKATPEEICGDKFDNNCDGQVDEECDCTPGESGPCYSGDPKTEGVGPCKKGTRQCLPNGKWGRCTGEVTPQTESCDGLDNDCDNSVDEDFPEKDDNCTVPGKQGPCSRGKYSKCVNAVKICKQVYFPKTETCDGEDNDCDGIIDPNPPCQCQPGKTQSCYSGPVGTAGKGPCKKGRQTCDSSGKWSGCIGEVTPQAETCNGLDDDCDGKADDGNPGGGGGCVVIGKKGICQAGRKECKAGGTLKCVQIQQPSIEVCDNKDNDCDGTVDESDPGEGKPCILSNQQGACKFGEQQCEKGSLVCKQTVQAKLEECNGIDDDCDGQIDNVKPANVERCSNQKGVCQGTTKQCAGIGQWVQCSDVDYQKQRPGDYQTQETLCDGKDNDCDGQTDEGLSAVPCYTGPSGTKGVGLCHAGTKKCENGQWSPCQKDTVPVLEICDNNQDDDCNGKVDDDPVCSCWGTGLDKDLTVSNIVYLTTYKGSRQTPYMVSHRLKALSSDGLTLTLDSVAGLAPGDELLLIHLQGNTSQAGTYEFVRVHPDASSVSTSGKQVKLRSKSKKIAAMIAQNDPGKHLYQVIRVPQFKRVVVKGSGTLTAISWKDARAGMVVFRAQEGVFVEKGGKIALNGVGYQGGPSLHGNKGEPQQGESYPGPGQAGVQSANGGGGGIHKNEKNKAHSGGGGGYGTNGASGTNADGKRTAAGGKIYGGADLNQLFLGSGGGAGAGDEGFPGDGDSSKNHTGGGGSGGGLIAFFARKLDLKGTIKSNGTNGQNADSNSGELGGGGGGSGGSILVRAQEIVLSTGARIVATGGSGGKSEGTVIFSSSPYKDSRGGGGGVGRIRIDFDTLNNHKVGSSGANSILQKQITPAPYPHAIPAFCPNF